MIFFRILFSKISFLYGGVIFLFLIANTSLCAQPILQYTIEDGLPTQHIYDALEGPEGFIWFATNRGLVKFDGYEFKTFTHKDGLPNNDVWKMRIDAERRLWFFSKSNLQGYVQNDSIHTFKTTQGNIISPNSVFAYPDGITLSNQLDKFKGDKFIENPDANIYNITYSKKFVDIKNDTVIITDKNKDTLNIVIDRRLKKYSSIKFDYFPHEHYIIRGFGWTIFVNDKTNQIKVHYHEDLDFTKNKVVLVKYVNGQYQMSNAQDLVILNKDFQVIHHYKFDPSIDNNYALKDSQGNIWLWGKKIGVKLITSTQLKAKHFLVGDKINVVGQMARQIVTASESDGFHYYDDNSSTFKPHPFIKTEYPDVPYNIIKDDKADYLITTQIGFKYDSIKGFSRVKSLDVEGYRGGKDFIEYQGNDYWVTSNYLLSNALGLRIEAKGLNDIEIWNNDLILSTSEGLKVLKNQEIISYLPLDSTLNFPTTRLVKGKHNLWIGTNGKGVYSYNAKGLQQIKSTEDLIIQEIIEDKDILWVATDKGVKKIKLHAQVSASKIVDNYLINDGLLQNSINDIYLKNDSLWIASDKGISLINISAFDGYTPTQLYFKNVDESIRIKETENRSFTIAFSAKNYGNQENLKFSYRLLPSEEWIPTDARNLSFNNLKPDQYTLEIQSTDQHFKVNKVVLPIVVLPLWWETNLAIVLFFIAGIILLLLLAYWFYNSIQHRKIKKIKQEKQMQALRLQALRSQMNPHFVHNSLNAIQYFIQMNDVEKSEEYLSKFSELIRLFFEFSREDQIPLEKEIKLLKRYMEIEKLRFEDRLNYKIEIDPNLHIAEETIPTMILQPLVENAINHGLFHKKDGGNIKLKFEKLEEDSYKVIIEDDGIGVEKAKEIFKESTKNYKSNSSMVLDERLKLLNQSENWCIKFNIDSNSIGEQTGTKITIIFKQ